MRPARINDEVPFHEAPAEEHRVLEMTAIDEVDFRLFVEIPNADTKNYYVPFEAGGSMALNFGGANELKFADVLPLFPSPYAEANPSISNATELTDIKCVDGRVVCPRIHFGVKQDIARENADLFDPSDDLLFFRRP